jgi:hypothetical protein
MVESWCCRRLCTFEQSWGKEKKDSATAARKRLIRIAFYVVLMLADEHGCNHIGFHVSWQLESLVGCLADMLHVGNDFYSELRKLRFL